MPPTLTERTLAASVGIAERPPRNGPSRLAVALSGVKQLVRIRSARPRKTAAMRPESSGAGVARCVVAADTRADGGATHEHGHDQGWRRNLLQGLGEGSAHRLQPWM